VRVKPWPWPGAVVVGERHADSGREAFHLFARWCHLASADSADALAAAAERTPAFDLDTWRIFSRWLAVPGNPDRVRPL